MQDITKRVVIALEDSSRLEGFLAQPGGDEFSQFRAIDNRRGGHISEFDVEEFERVYRRPPRAGEIGCTLSHVSVMRSFAREGGPGDELLLVAEDDARFSIHLEAALEAILQWPKVTGLVVLGDPYGRADHRDRAVGSSSEHFVQLSALARPLRLAGGAPPFRIGRWAAGLTGAGLYLITRDACRAVDDYLNAVDGRKPWWVADYHGFYRDTLGCDVLFVRPNLVSWEGESSIQGDDHVEWRAGASARPSGLVRGIKPWIREHAHRAELSAKSTAFDVKWRLRHR